MLKVFSVRLADTFIKSVTIEQGWDVIYAIPSNGNINLPVRRQPYEEEVATIAINMVENRIRVRYTNERPNISYQSFFALKIYGANFMKERG